VASKVHVGPLQSTVKAATGAMLAGTGFLTMPVAPLSSVTVRVTLCGSPEAYTWWAVGPESLVPSPNCQT
jgi:hypothetical protein